VDMSAECCPHPPSSASSRHRCSSIRRSSAQCCTSLTCTRSGRTSPGAALWRSRGCPVHHLHERQSEGDHHGHTRVRL
jgi:hypothetical protein